MVGAETTSAEGAGADELAGKQVSIVRRVMIAVAASGVALVFVGLMVAGIGFLHLRAAAEASPEVHPPVPVETQVVKIQNSYKETTKYIGRLEPARQTSLAFERGGLVTAVLRDEGDTVKAGDVIAKLDTAQLEAGRRQLEAQVRELEARRDLAKLTLGRQNTLKSKGWSPEQRFDEAEASVSQLNAAIDQVKARIASTDIDIAKSAISAPFSGVVSARMMDEGAVVNAGAPILTLLESGHRQARVGLPPDVAAKLDQAVAYVIQAGDVKLRATVHSIRPDLQSGTRTSTVLFDVSGADGVPFGEIVALALDREIEGRGAWVPLAALKESHRGLWGVLTVSEIDGQSVVRSQAAEILHVNGEAAFIRGTFGDGERIVSGGTNRVVSGQRVALSAQ